MENLNVHGAKLGLLNNFLEKTFGVKIFTLLAKMESPVKSKILGVKGSIDSIIGTLIIELKTSFERELNDAKIQLKKYFQGMKELKPENEYLGLITDGIKFKIYKSLFYSEILEEIIEIDQINLKEEEREYEKVFFWFDKYFFISQKNNADTKQFSLKFGVMSPTYMIIEEKLLKLLDMIWNEPSVKNKFHNWERYLEIVYGGKLTNKKLFIKHTYLASFAKLIIYAYFFKNMPKREDIIQIYSGKSFEQRGIFNFIENDFFSWIMHSSITDEILNITLNLLKEINTFELDTMNEDIFKGLYQELVDPEVRHELGEYYTHDWLAEYIIEKMNPNGELLSIMDPACGSGTFLFSYINYLIKKNSKINDKKLLNFILNNVIGIDIHPLAIIIAKANYLIAIQRILPKMHRSISIPIFLGDSINLPKIKKDLLSEIKHYSIVFPLNDIGNSSKKITVDKNKRKKTNAKNDKSSIEEFEFKIPYRCNKSPQVLSEILEITNKFLSEYNEQDFNLQDDLTSFTRILNKKEYKLMDEEIKIFVDNLKILYDLLQKGKDSIWIYVIRNIYHTILSQYRKFDLVAGNPPWLLLRFIKNQEYQKIIKKLYFKYDLLDKKDTHFMTNLELAHVFFYKTFDNYVKVGGKIGFVLPKTVLSSNIFDKFRKFKTLNIKLDCILDLERVSPLFRMSSCSILGTKTNENVKYTDIYPVPLEIISGELNEKNLKLDIVRKDLTIQIEQYEPPEALEESYYTNKFIQGATFNPMCFYYMELPSHELGIDIETPYVQTKFNKYARSPWNSIVVRTNIEKKFLFGTVLSGDLIPFNYVNLSLLICPILLDVSGNISLFKSHKECKAQGYPKMARYLKDIELLWSENATDQSRKMTVYQRLDYRQGLTKQNTKKGFRILYTAIGTNLVSSVLNLEENYSIIVDNIKIPLEGVLADNGTYFYETNNRKEAFYLCSIFNSSFLNEKIKQYQSRGQWGARNIHKLPLKFPIPRYSNEKIQNNLAKLGEIAKNKIYNELNSIRAYKSAGKRRAIAREIALDELKEIDNIVKTLL